MWEVSQSDPTSLTDEWDYNQCSHVTAVNSTNEGYPIPFFLLKRLVRCDHKCRDEYSWYGAPPFLPFPTAEHYTYSAPCCYCKLASGSHPFGCAISNTTTNL